MKKIKVLICGSARNEKGGISSVINQLLNHEWSSDIEISYLATHISGNTIKKSFFFISAYIKLYLLIRKEKFDIIHIHMSYKGSFYRKYIIANLCKRHNKKVILHLHGSEFKEFYNSGSKRLKRKIKELLYISDEIILLGEYWKDYILSIVPNAHVKVISNAIHINKWIPKNKHKNTAILFLGSLIRRKGVMDLLQAALNVIESGESDFIIYIAGSGVEETSLRQYCNTNHMEKYIEFLGWINEQQKKELFNASDFLVLPSYNEGLPIAILEAISYGLPVISTDVGSISEAVIDNMNGFLYKPGDIFSLENYLRILIRNDKQWKDFSVASRKIAEDKFSEEVFFNKIEKIYQQLSK